MTQHVTTPEELARQAEMVARVRAARGRRDQADEAVERATAELNAAIVAAYESGALVRDIAAAAGISRQRVHQIIRSS